MYKILSVLGTRPEAIKMAPVISVLSADPNMDARLAVTGQHREMLEQALNLFAIDPDYDLKLMRHGQTLPEITASMLTGLDRVLKEFRPELVLVHGDTATTLAASLAAYYNNVPVGHVEAGLRTGNIYSPWPEEINRKVAGTISSIHFAPTDEAKNNLLSENVCESQIHVTGNTVIDALLSIVSRIENDVARKDKLDSQFGIDSSRRIILVTGHRRESFGKGFQNLCDALIKLAEREDVLIIYPVHLNPNVFGPVQERLRGVDRIKLIEPQDYLPFVYLMSQAHIILTDSGGVQEEAPSLGKPVLVMREVTERPEAVQAGTVKMVGTNTDLIIREVTNLLDNVSAHAAMARQHNPYGDGQAAERIHHEIVKYSRKTRTT